MIGFNNFIILGRLTAKPKIYITPEGHEVCNLRVASTQQINRSRKRNKKNSTPKEETLYIDLEVFGSRARVCYTQLREGAPIFAEGRIKVKQWKNKETGIEFTKYKVHVKNIVMLERYVSKSSPKGNLPVMGKDTSIEEIDFPREEISAALNSFSPPEDATTQDRVSKGVEA